MSVAMHDHVEARWPACHATPVFCTASNSEARRYASSRCLQLLLGRPPSNLPRLQQAQLQVECDESARSRGLLAVFCEILQTRLCTVPPPGAFCQTSTASGHHCRGAPRQCWPPHCLGKYTGHTPTQQKLLMASGCGGPLRRMLVAQTCIDINLCGRQMDRIAMCAQRAKCMGWNPLRSEMHASNTDAKTWAEESACEEQH